MESIATFIDDESSSEEYHEQVSFDQLTNNLANSLQLLKMSIGSLAD